MTKGAAPVQTYKMGPEMEPHKVFSRCWKDFCAPSQYPVFLQQEN